MSVNLINSSDIKVSQTNNDISLNLVDRLDMFNDASGANWQDMMKNKLDYCINNINTTKTNIETFINGGWNGVNYGFGVFSKTENIYQLIWFSSNATYYCRKLGNGNYEYKDMSITDTGWVSITPATGTWTSLRYRVIGKLVQVMGYASSLTLSNGSAGVVGAVPKKYMPSLSTYGIATGASAWIGRANINTVNGNISIDAARTVSGAYSGSGYCGFSVMYFLD